MRQNMGRTNDERGAFTLDHCNQCLHALLSGKRIADETLIRERVPIWQRGATIAAVGLIFSPIDVPTLVPFAGQFWDFTLAVVVLDVFINNAPAHVVNEHIQALGLENKIPLRRI